MFLTWDPLDYDNLTVLRLPCHKIWLPDIVLYNKYVSPKLIASINLFSYNYLHDV